MEFEPIFDRVIVKEINDNFTTSGISLNENQSSIKKAKVISVGNGCYEYGVFICMQVKIGDIILFEDYAGAKFTSKGEDYILLKQTDILAKQKEN